MLSTAQRCHNMYWKAFGTATKCGGMFHVYTERQSRLCSAHRQCRALTTAVCPPQNTHEHLQPNNHSAGSSTKTQLHSSGTKRGPTAQVHKRPQRNAWCAFITSWFNCGVHTAAKHFVSYSSKSNTTFFKSTKVIWKRAPCYLLLICINHEKNSLHDLGKFSFCQNQAFP